MNDTLRPLPYPGADPIARSPTVSTTCTRAPLTALALTLTLAACSEDSGAPAPAPEAAADAQGTTAPPGTTGATNSSPVDVADRSVEVTRRAS